VENTNDVILNGIKRSPWFKELPDRAIELLAELCSVRDYAAGKVIFGFGDERINMYGIVSGSVGVTMTSDQGQKFNMIDLHENFWFGESAILNNPTKIITVTSNVQTRVLELPAKGVIEIADQFPTIYKNMCFDRLRAMQMVFDLMSGLLAYSLKARMAMRLLSVIEQNGQETEDGILLNPCLNLKDWAKLAMGSMQRVTRIFDAWVDDGAIIHHQGGWLIPSAEIFKIEINRG